MAIYSRSCAHPTPNVVTVLSYCFDVITRYGVGFDTASLRPALSQAWCIEFRGWFYRTLSDGWDPHCEGRNDQEGIYLPLPFGFEMVPEEMGDGGSREVVARHPWSTSVIVLGNGVGW